MKIRFLISVILIMFCCSCAKGAANPVRRIEESKIISFDLRGIAVWKGPRYVVYPIATAAYRGACGTRKGVQIIRVDSVRRWHLRLLDVVAWLEPIVSEMTPEELEALAEHRVARAPESVQIYERECEYWPRFTTVPVGSSIEIVNEDRKDHWVVVEGKNKKREQYVQYYGDTPPEFTFETPGVHKVPRGAPVTLVANKVDRWKLESGFHIWMNAWIFITDKIWYGKVEDDGYFKIKNVPRGKYNLVTWHPILGENRTVIRVPEDIKNDVSVLYYETPEIIKQITSTNITTFGEVREEKSILKEIDEW